MKKAIFLSVLCALACAVSSCGHDSADEQAEETVTAESTENFQEESTETTEEQAESTESEETQVQAETVEVTEIVPVSSEIAETPEDAVRIMIDSINSRDEERFCNICCPFGMYELYKYVDENEDGDIMPELLNGWFSKGNNIEITGDFKSESYDEYDEEVRQMYSMLKCVVDSFGEYDTENNDYDGFESYMSDLVDDLEDNPESLSDYVTDTKKVSFDLTGESGETENAWCVVYCIDGEGWKVDTMCDICIQQKGYIEKAKQKSAIAMAKSLYNASNTVLTYMECDGISVEDGIISSDRSLNTITDEEVLEKFYKGMLNYYAESEDIDYFVVIKDSIAETVVCIADDGKTLGAYPVTYIQGDSPLLEGCDLEKAYEILKEEMQ